MKIEIKQELTLERQAFDAHMSIANGYSNISLNNVKVEVYFQDENKKLILSSSDANNTDARFFIRLDSVQNISDVSGSGTVAAAATADIHWLIIPAKGASNGNPSGTLYYVGAKLTYKINGEEQVTEVSPDYIYVEPMPDLTLDYFLPYDVYGDDPFTSEIEPCIPFSLGVRVKNNGYGAAQNLKIESAQPRIVDNKQGLLVSFVITGSEVQGQEASRSLLADFGTIKAAATKVARWIMTASLSGRFVEFAASYTHSDALGGEMTSLIEEIKTHTLVQDVLADLPGRDEVKDFLARDGQSPDYIYTLYESDNLETQVSNLSGSVTLTPISTGNMESVYEVQIPVTSGFLFFKTSDPFSGTKVVKTIVRSDGKILPSVNAWFSKERPAPPNWNYYFSLFDVNGTGKYTVVFTDPSQIPQAPVLNIAATATGAETTECLLDISASDPNGTVPVLSTLLLPSGASFLDNGDGTGALKWTPEMGQAGVYYIAFKASDGKLSDVKRCRLKINTAEDKDGDSMKDEWELANFGTLDRDGTQDYDGDGLTDLEEYLNETNPGQGSAPGVPEIDLPLAGAEVESLKPMLQVLNSADPDGDAVQYYYEIFPDEYMVTAVESGTIDSSVSGSITSWNVKQVLEDNHFYYWRVRATDGAAYSQWAYGGFFVNTQNDAPSGIKASQPLGNTEVNVYTPLLEVCNCKDMDRDALTYRFSLFNSSGQVIITSPDLAEGKEGITGWSVNIPLLQAETYSWKAVSEDEHGSVAETPLYTFKVNTANRNPEKTMILSPSAGVEISSPDVNLAVMNVANPDEDGDPVYYVFELDKEKSFNSSSLQSSGNISEGVGRTLWQVSDLADNTLYYWRVKTNDGYCGTDWVYGSFFVNIQNDIPSVPTLKNPGNHPSLVQTRTPVLEMNPSYDPDQDTLTYLFEIYNSPDLQQLIASGESSVPKWQVPVELEDWKYYYWRVRVRDSEGALSDWTRAFGFYVREDSINDAPEFTFIEPAGDDFCRTSSYVFQWDDKDEDSNAVISLYYASEQGSPGVFITEGITEDPDASADSYTWDVSAIPDGAYNLYAEISDGTTTIRKEAPGIFVLDRHAPQLTLTPEAGRFTDAQTITMTVDEKANIYYTLDGSDPTERSVQYVSPIILDQSCHVRVFAVDKAGNQSPVSDHHYIIGVDTKLNFIEKAEGWTKQRRPFWRWTMPEWIPDFEGFAVSLDGGEEILVTDPSYTTPELSEGRHEISVRLKYGGVYGEVLKQSFGIDLTPPVLERVSLNNNAAATSSTTVVLTLNHNNDGQGSGVAAIGVSIDGGAFQELYGTDIILPSSYGNHMVSVKLKDKVGLESEVKTDTIILSGEVKEISGTSPDAVSATLKDLDSNLSVTVLVENGIFKFENIPSGTYGLFVENTRGVKAYPGKITLYEGTGKDLGVLDVGNDLGSLSGTVNPGLEGVKVVLGRNLGFGCYLSLKETVTDNSGHYVFEGLSPGIYQVYFIPPYNEGVASAVRFIEISTAMANTLDLNWGEGSGLKGNGNTPDFRFGIWDENFAFYPALTDSDGVYGLMLPKAGYLLYGRTQTLLLPPLAVNLQNQEITQNVTTIEKEMNITGKMNNNLLVLNNDSLSGIQKSLFLTPKNSLLPLREHSSQTVETAAEDVTFKMEDDGLQGGSLEPVLMSCDYNNDIYSSNTVDYIYNGYNEYTLAQKGACISGTISHKGTFSGKFRVFIYNASNVLKGYCECGMNGHFFFRNIPAGEYTLKAVLQGSLEEALFETLTLAEGEVKEGMQLNFKDTTPPVISVEPYIEAEAEAAQGTAVNISVKVTDDTDSAPELISDAPALFPLGETSVTFTAKDSSGNQSTATVKIIVKDTTAPVFSGSVSDIIVEATALKTPVYLTTPFVTDIFHVSVTNNAPAGFDRGTTQVTWEAADANGNRASLVQNVIVKDTTPPVLQIPADLQKEASGISTSVNIGQASATDIFEVTVSSNAPSIFPLGTTEVTWTATDSSGLSVSGVQKITVKDTTPPEITPPADITVEAAGSATQADIGKATATDIFAVTITHNAPSSFSMGETQITWEATDANGNKSTAVQKVTVADTTLPVLTLPADVEAEATGVTTAVNIGEATATDLFSVTVTGNALEEFPLGTTQVMWIATDANGLSVSGVQKVTVKDTTPPAITPPADVSVEATGLRTQVNTGSAVATDIFNVTLTHDAPADFPIGETLVKWNAVDANGNKSEALQKVIVKDTTLPELTLPADVTAEATAVKTPVTIGNATATDLFPVSITSNAPEAFDLGVTNVKWTAIDANGNVAEKEQKITLIDTTPPELTIPADITVESSGERTPVDIGQGTATDIFPVTVSNNAPAEGFAVGTTEVTWTAVDSSNNKTTQVQKITVEDSHNNIDVKIKFINSRGTGIQGGIVAFKEGNTWMDAGITDVKGEVVFTRPSSVTALSVRLTFNGSSVLFTQDIHTQPQFVFQTLRAVVVFKNSQGKGMAGGRIKYNMNNIWYDMGLTNRRGIVTRELFLPREACPVRITWDGVTYEKKHNFYSKNELLFQTVKVAVSLKNSRGGSVWGGTIKYQKGLKWELLGITGVNGEVSKEVFPEIKSTFMMTYRGMSQQKDIVPTVSTDLVFKMVKVTVFLKDKRGRDLLGGIAAYSNDSGIELLGITGLTGNISKEIIPGLNSTFIMLYKGRLQKKVIAPESNTDLVFQG